MPFLYHIIYFFVVGIGRLARLGVRWEIKGSKNVPQKGPLLVVANHMSQMDVLILASSLGRKATFMAKEELFHPEIKGWFFRQINCFPVRKGETDVKAIRDAIQVLSKGRVLIMFPEGHRSRESQLKQGLTGSVLVAIHSGTPIIPVGISGTDQFKNFASLFRRPLVTVNIGQAFYLPNDNGRLTKEKRAELTDILMNHIAELLPEEYQGLYGKQNGN